MPAKGKFEHPSQFSIAIGEFCALHIVLSALVAGGEFVGHRWIKNPLFTDSDEFRYNKGTVMRNLHAFNVVRLNALFNKQPSCQSFQALLWYHWNEISIFRWSSPVQVSCSGLAAPCLLRLYLPSSRMRHIKFLNSESSTVLRLSQP